MARGRKPGRSWSAASPACIPYYSSPPLWVEQIFQQAGWISSKDEANRMKAMVPSKIQEAVNALLTQPAFLSPRLRQTVEAHAAGLGGGVRPAGELPAELVDYVNKVALYAYKVTDEDV